MKNGLGVGFLTTGFCTALILCAVAAYPQSLDEVHVAPRSDSPKIGEVPRIEGLHIKPMRVDVDLVLVPVSVNDLMNRPVTTLKQEDFALYEEDKQQQIRYFSTEDAPISVAILLDISKSMSDKIDTERFAIREFFQNAHPEDEYFAITFSDRPRVLGNSTGSVDELEKRLIAVEPGGPTAMLDAVYLAASKLRSARYQRKAIVIFSDGGDNASRYTMREIKSMVKESDVQIYAIGLFDVFFFNSFEERMGKAWLGEITDVTGGHTITVENRAKVPEAAATISRELRNQYVLGYRPQSSTAHRWRKIKVELKPSTVDRRLRAYYRKGYFAQDTQDR